MYKKMEMTHHLNFDFMNHFVDEVTLSEARLDQDMVSQLNPRTLKFLGELAKTQDEIYQIQILDYVDQKSIDSEEEEEEESVEDPGEENLEN